VKKKITANYKSLKTFFMKRTCITLQTLIAAKMNVKNNAVKQTAEPAVKATHHIF
jgi:hypothetical protein